MKKPTLFVVLIFIIAAICTSSINAQSKLGIIGQKFTAKEANILFGKVITSVKVNKRALHFAVARANDYVYLKVKNNRAYVLNEKRVSLLDDTLPINPKERLASVANGKPALPADEVVYLVSTSVLAEFLNSSTAEEISFENREGVFTLNDGEIVLEKTLPCPPNC